MRRGTRRRGGVLGVMVICALAVTLTASVAPATAAPASTVFTTNDRDAAVSVDNVAVLGQTRISVSASTDDAFAVASVHGVRRVPDGTVLYWSAGFPKDNTDQSPFVLGLWPKWFAYDRYGSSNEPRGTSIVDPVGRKVYEPLIVSDGGKCICSRPNVSRELGDVSVLYAVMPALPEDVTHVDVRLGFGSIIQDVPVEDGTLEPSSPADDRTVLLGQEWPAIDLDAVSSSFQPEKAIYPLTTRTATEDGAVSTEEQPDEVTLNLSADVLFTKDSATLSSKAASVLREAADQINASASGGALEVVGHTDSDAGTTYNQELSERRAVAVTSALKKLVSVPVTFKTSGRGETQPIASNKSSKGKALNRRVSVTFAPKDAS